MKGPLSMEENKNTESNQAEKTNDEENFFFQSEESNSENNADGDLKNQPAPKIQNTDSKKKKKTSSIFSENFEESLSPITAIVYFLIFYFGNYALAFICSLFLGLFFKDQNDLTYLLLANIIPNIILIITVVLLLTLKKKNNQLKVFSKKINVKKTLLTMLVGFLVLFFGSIVLSMISSAIYQAIFHTPFESNNNQQLVEQLVKQFKIPSFFLVVVFAPFIEEILYRLFLLNSMKKYPWVGIIVSALIFGFLHFDISSILLSLANSINSADFTEFTQLFMIETLNLPSYIFSGLVLAFAYRYTNTIYTSMTIHFVNNLISYVLIFIPTGAILFNGSLIQSIVHLI